VLGLGANVLVPDAGLDAAVLMLVDRLADIEVDGARLRAGGGAQLARVVRAALDAVWRGSSAWVASLPRLEARWR